MKADISDKGEGTSRRSTTEGKQSSRQPAEQRQGKAKIQKQSQSRRSGIAVAKRDPGDVGASKIKAALRQTRRLLAKDKLASDVRQEAERRLASLESDLVRKESSEKERKNAERYHKVRFFERQKLTRQIKKIKKALAEAPEKKQKKLENELREKRVLLNYVLHYPTSVKYVALFPSSGESPLEKPAEVKMETEQSRRARQSHESAIAVRRRVEASMHDGTLSQEPEVELERRYAEGSVSTSAKRTRLDISNTQDLTASDVSGKKRKRSSDTGGRGSTVPAAKGVGPGRGIEDDDFFATGDGDD